MSRHRPRALCSCLAAAAFLLSCGGGGSNYQPFPRYFAFDGAQAFVASRNIAGRSVEEINALLDKARDEGTTLVRFHVTHAFLPAITNTGEVVESWAASWDAVFEHAAANGIHVLPVFGVWADWNDGSAGETWHLWHENPLNVANGGPASSPANLYRSGSPAQLAWIGWMSRVAERWQAHANVAGWEIFSELDLVTHTNTEARFQNGALGFVQNAAAALRAVDPQRRPVTASLAAWGRWLSLYASDAIDLVQVHTYEREVPIDIMLEMMSEQLRGLGKPMLLGESGLDARPPDGTTNTTAAAAPLGTRQGVWGALVHGFMNGRALWWEDGYAILQNGDSSVPFVTGYPAVESSVLAFLGGRDLAGMRPLSVDHWPIEGGAIGSEQTVLGWFRNWSCGFPAEAQPPDCVERTGYSVSIVVPGTAPSWTVQFHDPETGAPAGAPVALERTGHTVVVPLPAFTNDIAFVLSAAP